MRVCLISREYPPDTGFGGIATFTRHLAHGLKVIGNEVVVIALAKEGKPAELQDDGGIPVHRVVPLPIGTNLGWTSFCMPYSRYVMRTSSALFAKFEELSGLQPFDVVDTPELLAEGFFPAITKCTPLIIRLYTPHSKFIAERLHNVTDTFDHQFVAMVERIAMLMADVITSPSRDLAEFVAADLGIELDEIDIVHNPIDATEFHPDGPGADLGIDRSGFTVLFVGRLEARKGIHYLIEAVPKIVAAVPNAHIVVIGDDTQNAPGQKSVLAEIKEQLAKTGSANAVTFIDRVPLADLPMYYRAADVCVVPSLYDNSPYTCLEAMSCGRAVVGTDAGGTKEYIVNGESGLIVPARDSDALARSVIDLLINESERRRLAANARQRVLAVFARAEIARKTVELYRKAAERFSIRSGNSVYKGPTSKVLFDADRTLYLFDSMIRELILDSSLSVFWADLIRLSVVRPRLAAARLCIATFKTLGLGSLSFVVRLEESAKQRSIHKLVLGEPGNPCLEPEEVKV